MSERYIDGCSFLWSVSLRLALLFRAKRLKSLLVLTNRLHSFLPRKTFLRMEIPEILIVPRITGFIRMIHTAVRLMFIRFLPRSVLHQILHPALLHELRFARKLILFCSLLIRCLLLLYLAVRPLHHYYFRQFHFFHFHLRIVIDYFRTGYGL
jgi:hypothetical protein